MEARDAWEFWVSARFTWQHPEAPAVAKIGGKALAYKRVESREVARERGGLPVA